MQDILCKCVRRRLKKGCWVFTPDYKIDVCADVRIKRILHFFILQTFC